jgi:hypothetical protein
LFAIGQAPRSLKLGVRFNVSEFQGPGFGNALSGPNISAIRNIENSGNLES